MTKQIENLRSDTMEEFIERKLNALHDERQSYIRVIQRAMEALLEGDFTCTTASNIVVAATQLVQVHAEITAYEMTMNISRIK